MTARRRLHVRRFLPIRGTTIGFAASVGLARLARTWQGRRVGVRGETVAARLVPVGAREDCVTVHGGLRILRAGDGNDAAVTALLIHGGGYDNSAISWFHLFDELGSERQVVAVDLPGFGGSIEAPPVGGPARMAEVVAEVMGALGISPVVVFGCSMGGDVALHLALARPDLVAGLVLVGPGGLTPLVKNRLTHTLVWAGTKAPDWVLSPATRLANRFAGAALKGFVHDRDAIPDQVLAEFIAEAMHPRAGIAYGRYNQTTIGRTGMRNDLTRHLGRIIAPTLIVHGAKDVMVDVAGSRRAAGLMPEAELVIVPDCGHWAQLERPQTFLAASRSLLARVDATRSPN